jgi:2-polyprenyl-3-methyl-5-hydroxy-6-metoxy-1,4-benzoquinol methylase
MPDGPGHASPDLASRRRDAPSAPVERFEPDRFRDELVEAEHLVRYLWAAGAVADRDVLDAGCGTGYGCALLAERGGARHCLGVDISEEAVAEARGAYGDGERIEFSVGDVTALDAPDASIDVVTCFETIEHVTGEAQRKLLAECARVLRPGGMLLLSSPNREQYPPGNPHHLRELTADELRALLCEVFAHVQLVRQHNWLASAILDDEAFAAGGADNLEVETAKVQGRAPGSELYTLAVCSDEPVSLPPSRALLTHGLEVRRWIEEIELHKLGHEETKRALAAAERELLELRDERSVTVGRLEDRVYWLDRSQVDLNSWMRRRPVRFMWQALARLLRMSRGLRRR